MRADSEQRGCHRADKSVNRSFLHPLVYAAPSAVQCIVISLVLSRFGNDYGTSQCPVLGAGQIESRLLQACL